MARATTPRRALIVAPLDGDLLSIACPYCGQSTLWTRSEAQGRRAHSIPCGTCESLAMMPDITDALRAAPQELGPREVHDPERVPVAPLRIPMSGDRPVKISP